MRRAPMNNDFPDQDHYQIAKLSNYQIETQPTSS
jgi:hypothetical protein